MKKKIFVLVVLCSVVLPVFAANWKQIGEKEYIDASSIKPYNDRNKKEFWVKSLYDGSLKDIEIKYNIKIAYFINNYIIDCNNKTISLKSWAMYDTNNDWQLGENIPDKKMQKGKIVPETKSELYYKYVCK